MLTLFSDSQVLHLAALEEVPSQEVGGGSSADGNLILGCTTTKQSYPIRWLEWLTWQNEFCNELKKQKKIGLQCILFLWKSENNVLLSLTLQISTCLSAGVDIIKTWKSVLPTHDKKKKIMCGHKWSKKSFIILGVWFYSYWASVVRWVLFPVFSVRHVFVSYQNLFSCSNYIELECFERGFDSTVLDQPAHVFFIVTSTIVVFISVCKWQLGALLPWEISQCRMTRQTK